MWPAHSAPPAPACIAPETGSAGASTDNCTTADARTTKSKSAGYRIELGEIRAALAALDGVEHAAVIAREDQPGDKRLVGYLAGTADPAAVRTALAQQLPPYMIPAAVVALDTLPLTPNGKLDTHALPPPDYHTTTTTTPQPPPPKKSSATSTPKSSD